MVARTVKSAHVLPHNSRPGAASLLAYAVFGVLQTEAFVEGELDPHVGGRHQPPDDGGAPGIRAREIGALDHSLPSRRDDLLLLGILHPCSRTCTKHKSHEEDSLVLRFQHLF